MYHIYFEGMRYLLRERESVLDCLLRHGVKWSHSCKRGVCQSCILRVVKGTVTEEAQPGLRDTLRAQGYALPCVFVPESDLELAPIDDPNARVRATITKIEPLNKTVMRVLLRSETPVTRRAGQFVNVRRCDGLVRTYSPANVPNGTEHLELHVAIVPGGRMSGWIYRGDALGAAVDLLGPAGNCFYVAGRPRQPLFLAGTGTGLAPLIGIARDALQQGHDGPIHLFHGAARPEELYLVDDLRTLAAGYENFRYYASVLEGSSDGVVTSALDAFSLTTVPDLAGHKVYLCGDPDMVRLMQRKAFHAGAALGDIYADAYFASPD